MLRMNGLTRDDVEIVEFPYPDDWHEDPAHAGAVVQPVRDCAEAGPQARPGIPPIVPDIVQIG